MAPSDPILIGGRVLTVALLETVMLLELPPSKTKLAGTRVLVAATIAFVVLTLLAARDANPRGAE